MWFLYKHLLLIFRNNKHDIRILFDILIIQHVNKQDIQSFELDNNICLTNVTRLEVTMTYSTLFKTLRIFLTKKLFSESVLVVYLASLIPKFDT